LLSTGTSWPLLYKASDVSSEKLRSHFITTDCMSLH